MKHETETFVINRGSFFIQDGADTGSKTTKYYRGKQV